jgi:hypothetical protein
MRHEQTGIRDLRFSELHRKFGENCCMQDVDCIEYDNGKVVAIIELKHENIGKMPDADCWQMRVYKDLASERWPLFCTIYSDDLNDFWVSAYNQKGLSFVPAPMSHFSKSEYIDLMHILRGRIAPSVTRAELDAYLGA